jgi:collagenase-like PrtC family protease
MTARLNLSLGPVLYLWDGPLWRDFYLRIADEAPVEEVTIGEIVCSKRSHFIASYLPMVLDRLTRAGKRVRLGSLAMVTLERESAELRRLAEHTGITIEANDLSAIALLSGRTHAIGPFVNVYNATAARVFAERGAERICLPPELPAASIAAIVHEGPPIAFELFAFGRVPLAISARCAHARAKGRSKDKCQFVCGEDPDGLTVDTLDGQPFFALNGVQTVSYTCHALLKELDEIANIGVASARLSPQNCDMVAVARVYDDLLNARTEAPAALAQLEKIYPDVPFSNGFYHGVAGAHWVDS